MSVRTAGPIGGSLGLTKKKHITIPQTVIASHLKKHDWKVSYKGDAVHYVCTKCGAKRKY